MIHHIKVSRLHLEWIDYNFREWMHLNYYEVDISSNYTWALSSETPFFSASSHDQQVLVLKKPLRDWLGMRGIDYAALALPQKQAGSSRIVYDWVVCISDPQDATLFKLTWGGC